MTNPAIYLLFIIPIFILTFIIVKLLLNNSKMVETRLLSIALISFCLVLLEGLLRHTLLSKYIPFSFSILMGLCLLISLSTLLHLMYVLLVKYCHLQSHSFIVTLFYIPILCQVLALFLGFSPSIEDFSVRNIWIIPNTLFHTVWVFGIVSVHIMVAIILSAFGIFHAQSIHGKNAFRFFLIAYSLFFTAFIFTLFLKDYFPALSILLFMVMTSIIFIVGIAKFELIPSLTSRYQTMFEVSPTAIILLSNEYEVLEYNHHARNTFHATSSRSLLDLLHTIHNQKQGILLMKALKDSKGLSNFILDFENPSTLQTMILVFEATIISVGSNEYYYIMWRDITNDTEKELLAQYLAYHDALTGLHNRAYFVQHVEAFINQSTSTDLHALILIDLNSFKQINDNYGHSVGDLVLQHMASILQFLFKDPHIVARLGGDEYVLFLQNLQSIEELELAIAAIQQRCEADIFHFEDIQITISPSIGHSIYAVDGDTLEQLLHVSDVNMYINKAAIKQQQALLTEKN